MSQPTMPAVPQFPAGQPPAAPKSKVWIVFAVLAVFFFLAAAAMTGLYVVDKKTIADQKAKIASLERDLAAKDDEVAKTKADLDKANDDLAAAKADAEKNAACSEAVKEFFEAIETDDEAKGEKAALKMASACGVSLV